MQSDLATTLADIAVGLKIAGYSRPAQTITKVAVMLCTGKLIMLDDGAVERMAELQLAAFLAGRGSVTSMMHGTRTAKPGPTMDDYRRMSLAALKGTDHAG